MQSLRALSATCGDTASELAASGASTVSSRSFQPSAAAVDAMDSCLSAVAMVLAGRMAGTAQKLSAAATDFENQDDGSAAQIRAVII